MRLRPAEPADRQAIMALLSDAGLPALPEALLGGALVAEQGEQVLGCVGMEVCGDAALVRSLAVLAHARGTGVGLLLVRAVLEKARNAGAQTAVALTETAQRLCRRFGFEQVDWSEVPEALHASDEFHGACPKSAAAMRLSLQSPVTWLRLARLEDAPAIMRIKNQGIAERVATLDTEPLDPLQTDAWLTAHDARHPVLVAEREGGVVAFGSLNTFNPRPAYRFVADLSVYADRAARGEGIGRRIVRELLDRAQDLGYHKVVLAAFPFNAPARRLYLGLGFRPVGVYREQGLLDGRWVDVEVMERMLEEPR